MGPFDGISAKLSIFQVGSVQDLEKNCNDTAGSTSGAWDELWAWRVIFCIIELESWNDSTKSPKNGFG